jgi:GDP/UDP-N,N'-diacetylbacillosamine 2-epimerase (hydrolysing)
MKRKICVITGSRAEYWLLKPLMEKLKEDKDITLQILVTGMHLSGDFGLTYKDIERDGFYINKKIDIHLSSDTSSGIAKSMGLALEGFTKAYGRFKPDIVVLLGDRFEIFAAACAAYVSRIPIAHINGGEVTVGAFDDAFRHSITKMSSLHFVSTKEYRKRVIQLGEHPDTVFNVGATTCDSIHKTKFLTKKEIERKLNFKFNMHNVLITFHPVTLERNTAKQQFQNLLDAIDGLKDTNFIFTKSNADTGGRIINKMIDEYVAKNSRKAKVFASLGHLKYFSVMKVADVVLGNSSSGIIESPILKIATINIGDRQKGRLKPKSIIDCKPVKSDIQKALKLAFSNKFKTTVRNVKNPYYRSNVAGNIKKIIKEFPLGENILKKSFFDIKHKF